MPTVVTSQLAEAVALRRKLVDCEIRVARVAGREVEAAALGNELRCLERLPAIALERRLGPGRTGGRASFESQAAAARARIAELSAELRAASAKKRNRDR